MSDGGLDLRRDAEGAATYRFGLVNYDPCFVLGRALEAAGLPDQAILGSSGRTVEISPRQVVAINVEDQRSVLWTSAYGPYPALR